MSILNVLTKDSYFLQLLSITSLHLNSKNICLYFNHLCIVQTSFLQFGIKSGHLRRGILTVELAPLGVPVDVFALLLTDVWVKSSLMAVGSDIHDLTDLSVRKVAEDEPEAIQQTVFLYGFSLRFSS